MRPTDSSPSRLASSRARPPVPVVGPGRVNATRTGGRSPSGASWGGRRNRRAGIPRSLNVRLDGAWSTRTARCQEVPVGPCAVMYLTPRAPMDPAGLGGGVEAVDGRADGRGPGPRSARPPVLRRDHAAGVRTAVLAAPRHVRREEQGRPHVRRRQPHGERRRGAVPPAEVVG